ncbi:MAG: hypothetical protein UZ19_OD1000328 [Parcubacteria bacterium OLB19]|nr:MAG: hypothetical protein UZ19_OD1000328 [Parcubacteria bacterium OLB19]
MDNNLSEAVVREKKGFGLVLVAVMLILLLVIGWNYLSNTKEITVVDNLDTANNTEIEIKTLNANASIKSIDYDKGEMYVKLSSSEFTLGEKVNFGDKDVKLKLTQNTLIQKLIVSKDTDGSVLRSGKVELNLINLKEGDVVNVIFNGRPNDVLIENILSISSIVNVSEDKFTETLATESEKMVNSSMSYVKGRVVNLENSKIEYIPYLFNQAGTEKLTITLGGNTDIFSINDENRYNIKHAKKEINISDIKVGDDIFFSFNPEANLDNTDTVAKEVILIAKQ